MNLHQLRTFVGVYRAGSISRAAELLGIAQPAASAHIRALEGELGKPLFTRHARGVGPTAVADELARAVGSQLDGAEAAFERLRDRSRSIEGTVHMAGPPEFCGVRLPPVLAAFAETGIDIRLRLGGRDEIYRWLADEETDLAITASEPQGPALGHQVIAEERLLAVAAPRLAGQGGGAERLPWLAYDENLPLIRQLLAVWQPDLIDRLRLRLVVPSLTLLRDLAIEGAGATVLPDYLCADALARGELVTLSDAAASAANRLYLVWRLNALRQARVVFARDLIRRHLTIGSDRV